MTSDGRYRITPPSESQIEISVFGPGYGESILIHVGLNNWIIVDSCTDKNNLTASLDYLSSIGVDYTTNVKYIVITHWHDDHIRGITNVVRECKGAKVAISNALKCAEFLELVSCYKKEPFNSGNGVQEITNVFQLLKGTNRTFLASENQILWNCDVGDINCKLYSLSPSAEAMNLSRRELAKLIPEFSEDKRVIRTLKPNLTSVTLFLTIGSESFLLGSDLENHSNDKLGWQRILNDNTVINGKKSIFFKVSHHGSQNGDNPDVWKTLLEENPLCAITPFKRLKTPIPTDDDISRIKANTKNAYITESPIRKPFKHKNNTVKKIFDKNFVSVSYLENSSGRIRIRKNIGSDSEYSVELFGSAIEL